MMARDSIPLPKWARLIPAFLVIPVSLLASIGYLSGLTNKALIANADHLFLAEILPDLASGGRLSEWSVPFASYLVPDWPLYALSLFVTPNTSMAVAAFAFFQSLLLLAAARRLAEVFDSSIPTLLGLAGLASVALVATTDALPLIFLATAYTHFGTSIMVVFGLANLLDWVTTANKRSFYWSLAISALTVASDQLFIVWFLVPAALSVGLLWILKQIEFKLAARWIVAHIVAATLGMPWGHVIFPVRTRYPLEVGLSVKFGWRRFSEAMSIVHHHQPLLFGTIFALTGLIGWQLWRQKSLGGRQIEPKISITLAAFLFLTASATIGSQIIMNGPVPPTARYNTQIFMLPLLIAPIVTGSGFRWWRDGLNLRSGLTSAVLLVPVLVATKTAIVELPAVNFNASPIDDACITNALAETGSVHGIATYWDARPAEVFTDGAIQVSSVDNLFRPDTTNAHLSEFGSTYDFAINLEESQLSDRLGEPPISRTQCGRWLVLDWGPGGIKFPQFSKVGDQLTYDGCDLSSRITTPTPECTLVADSSTPDGEALAFGPYATLSPGEYELSFAYTSSNLTSTEVGRWDMTLNTVAVLGGNLAGTDGASESVVSLLVVDEYELRLPVFEIHVVANADIELEVESLTIRRTG